MDYAQEQTLILLLLKSFHDCYPDLRIIVDHSYGPGVYCRYEPSDRKPDLKRVKLWIENHLRGKVKIKPYPLDRVKLRRHFSKRKDIIALLSSRRRLFPAYRIDGYLDHIIGPVKLEMAELPQFDLVPHPPGFVLTWGRFQPRPKLFRMIQEYEEWAQILGVYDVGRLNRVLKEDFDRMVLLAEALHEKKIASIADKIIKRKKRLILIAGPSASGKTTFSKRLAIQLQVSKVRPVTISIDDYFLPREKTPTGPDGLPDFESLKAIDIELLNRDLNRLLRGRPVAIPKFNFRTGEREYRGRIEHLAGDDVLILEGIHGLNDRLTYAIPTGVKFRIYVSAITQLNIDDHNRIHTRDTRLIRRIVRDVQFRNHSAAETIRNWPRVVAGEDRYIFPFQEKADVMFNSALIYEFPVLSRYVRPLLKRVRDPEAHRLDQLLSYFLPAPDGIIPNNSILREFIGGSIFYY
ncbi:nucleoside kinase [candidate division WOR-3 bacterium]|uniref:Nucleoside kinase n=1 Tax=candidate division WOR-3 bacterium TaxID=2052148 RepID=A0A660SEV1_UNCW3|nr:MAG: nucleoside kinase [candidate division WOR-3 bacterium]